MVMDRGENAAPAAVDNNAQAAADNLLLCVTHGSGGAHSSVNEIDWLQQGGKTLATREIYDRGDSIYFSVNDKNYKESGGYLFEETPAKGVLGDITGLGVLGGAQSRKLSEKEPEYKEAAAALRSLNFNQPPCLKHD